MKKTKLNFGMNALSREQMRNITGGNSAGLGTCGKQCTSDSDCTSRFTPCTVCAPLNPNYNTCYTAPLS